MISKPENNMTCPGCGKVIIQQAINGRIKIRSNIMVFEKGMLSAIVVCKHCKKDVSVDVRMGAELLKALDGPTKRLVIRPIRKV